MRRLGMLPLLALLACASHSVQRQPASGVKSLSAHLSGHYDGNILVVEDFPAKNTVTRRDSVHLIFTDSTYICEPLPYTAAGSYTISPPREIVLQDRGNRTPERDPREIVQGVFTYRFDGHYLSLTGYDLPHHRVRKLVLAKVRTPPASGR